VTPSTNGTEFDGLPLREHVPAPIAGRSMLKLGGVFALDVIPLPCTGGNLSIGNLVDWLGDSAEPEPGPRGAVTFAPAAGHMRHREAVWLFTRADFAPQPDDTPRWLPAARGNPAAFLRIGGCFWLANLALPPGTVMIDDTPLAPGEAAPLSAGARLHLAGTDYRMESVGITAAP
jgi:hypothetical protein